MWFWQGGPRLMNRCQKHVLHTHAGFFLNMFVCLCDEYKFT